MHCQRSIRAWEQVSSTLLSTTVYRLVLVSLALLKAMRMAMGRPARTYYVGLEVLGTPALDSQALDWLSVLSFGSKASEGYKYDSLGVPNLTSNAAAIHAVYTLRNMMPFLSLFSSPKTYLTHRGFLGWTLTVSGQIENLPLCDRSQACLKAATRITLPVSVLHRKARTEERRIGIASMQTTISSDTKVGGVNSP